MAYKRALNSTPLIYKKVALVYDRVNKIGGAERVLQSLHKIYPDAPLYTLVHNQETAPWSKSIKVIPTFFNKLKWLRSHHEILAPVAAMAFETLKFDNYDLVISITSSEAKSVITKPATYHLCYCLTPTRYLWSGAPDYRLPGVILNKMRQDDLVYSQRPDDYLAISKEVQKRITDYYHRDSEVVYPGIDYKYFSALSGESSDDYYLVVGRQVPYKRTDLVIDAFNRLGKNLLIVGNGSHLPYLKTIAGKTIEFLSEVDDEKLRELYHRASALIFPQFEDFGLVPLEAQAAGTPVIAFGRGGAAETIVHQQTGLHFANQTADDIVASVKHFENGKHAITSDNCKNQALLFDENRFLDNFSAKVEALWQKHQETFVSSSPAEPAPVSGRGQDKAIPNSF